jgi:hypothetical protein
LAKAERKTGDETAPGARLVHCRAILGIRLYDCNAGPLALPYVESVFQHILVSLTSDNYANLAPFTVRDEKIAHGHFRVAGGEWGPR